MFTRYTLTNIQYCFVGFIYPYPCVSTPQLQYEEGVITGWSPILSHPGLNSWHILSLLTEPYTWSSTAVFKINYMFRVASCDICLYNYFLISHVILYYTITLHEDSGASGELDEQTLYHRAYPPPAPLHIVCWGNRSGLMITENPPQCCSGGH